MAKFYGAIGYATSVETSPDVWKEEMTERFYCGDLIRNSRRLDGGTQVNDNITISNEISIVSDPYANENFHAMRYVSFMGANWKITSVEVKYPRLILTTGGVWNGPTAGIGPVAAKDSRIV